MGGLVRVSALDVAHSHRRSAVVVGPVAVPPVTTVADRVLAMARAGPHTRIGLQPSTTSTRWRWAPDGAAESVRPAPPDADPVGLLEAVRAEAPRGLAVAVADEYLAVGFSHGLGEIPLLHALVDVILGSTDPTDDAVWAPYRHRTPALTLAAARGIALAPHRLPSLVRQHRRNVAAAPSGAALRAAPDPVVRVGCIPAGVVSALRDVRDRHSPGVSLFAVLTLALWESLRDSGFDVDPMVTLPFDVRRYLPAGHGTLASFSAGLDFDVSALGSGDRPAALHRRMAQAHAMARPVANLLAGTARMAAALRSGRTADWVAPAPAQVRLLHSSIGRVPRENRWEFTDPGRARVLVASEPAGPCGLTVTSASVPSGLWLTAEFHRSVFEPDRVSAALDSAAGRARELLASRSG
jgi:hypothetical protein